ALGRNGTPRKLGVPGEELPKVAYRLEDPGDFKDKDIVVVGGGDSAVEAAIALAAADGNRVRLSYRKNKFFRLKDLNQTRLDQMVGTGKLNVIMETDVREIGAREIRIRSAASEEVYPNDAVFIFAGGMPPFKLLEDIGVRFHGVEANRSKNG
ncbi:MAG TPA: NAD(P)-binding domain-containing protein, partial [Fibrobacteria bacterium]|nr:NAD(P)-binding domain-containing protein [Fibrobacteria bacterium]